VSESVNLALVLAELLRLDVEALANRPEPSMTACCLQLITLLGADFSGHQNLPMAAVSRRRGHHEK
jgi:hypothetical protein